MSLGEELKRKAIHLASSAVPLGYALWGSRAAAAIVLAAASAAMLAVEAFRHGEDWAGRTFRRLFGAMLREKEKRPAAGAAGPHGARWLGATPYCLASLACILLFPKPVAVLSLLYLAFGDTAASLVGRAWGRTRIGDKSLEGSLAFFVACCAAAILARAFSAEYQLPAGIAGALAATLAELFLTRIDDNFSIPLAAGVVMAAMRGFPSDLS